MLLLKNLHPELELYLFLRSCLLIVEQKFILTATTYLVVGDSELVSTDRY
jgi:hypothetical protein